MYAKFVVGHEEASQRAGVIRRDFYHRYDRLLASWYSLSSQAQRQVDSLRQDLHEDLARWRPQHPEPNWSAYSARVERIRPTPDLQ